MGEKLGVSTSPSIKQVRASWRIGKFSITAKLLHGSPDFFSMPGQIRLFFEIELIRLRRRVDSSTRGAL